MRCRATALGIALTLVIAACGGDGASPHTTSAAPVTVAPPRTASLTPLDPSRISGAEQGAVVALGGSGAGVPIGAHAHGHGADDSHVEMPMFTGDAATFANQWLVAQRSVPNFDTVAKAEALGYVRASTPGAGVGTHYVLWSQIAKPFDPAHPSMLLFDERKRPGTLVGYSYWLQSATPPVGFAGTNDDWHQHTGLCIVNGWVDREEASSAATCAGTYLAGGDLWMLHAWVVPKYPNRAGRFATFNPTLCPPIAGTPDDLRCPN
jgi:hypothetical protein